MNRQLRRKTLTRRIPWYLSAKERTRWARMATVSQAFADGFKWPRAGLCVQVDPEACTFEIEILDAITLRRRVYRVTV